MAVSPAGEYYPPGHPLGPPLTCASDLLTVITEAPHVTSPKPSLVSMLETSKAHLDKVRDEIVYLRKLFCSDRRPYVGFDFDGTLAHWVPGQHELGEPIARNVERAKALGAKNVCIKIITARMSPRDLGEADLLRLRATETAIENWCLKHLGFFPDEVTCAKKHGLIKLYDDRAVGTVENTGTIRHCDEEMTHNSHDGTDVVAPALNGQQASPAALKDYLHEQVDMKELEKLAHALFYNGPGVLMKKHHANDDWPTASEHEQAVYRDLALRAMVFFAERVSQVAA